MDLALGTMAVEVFGGNWHGYGRHQRRTAERYSYILASGRSVVVVWVHRQRYPLGEGTADYLAGVRLSPGEFRVIWGDGREAPTPAVPGQLALTPHRGR